MSAHTRTKANESLTMLEACRGVQRFSIDVIVRSLYVPWVQKLLYMVFCLLSSFARRMV